MNITPAQLGFIRALGVAIVLFVLSYIGDASHLNGLVSDSVATLIAGLALGVEHYIQAKTGSALFGSATVRRNV